MKAVVKTIILVAVFFCVLLFSVVAYSMWRKQSDFRSRNPNAITCGGTGIFQKSCPSGYACLASHTDGGTSWLPDGVCAKWPQ